MTDAQEAKWNVAEWHGKMLVDRNGETHRQAARRLCRRRDRRAPVRHGQGRLHRSALTFVPLAGIQVGPDDLQVTTTKEQVRSAPEIEMHGEELSQADESTLYHHFEMNYTPIDTESGRRLARR